MKLKLKVNKGGYIYLPNALREMLGTGEITALVNAKTVVLYKSEENFNDVSKSLGVIQQDIELRQDTLDLKPPKFEVSIKNDTIWFKYGNLTRRSTLTEIKDFIEVKGIDVAVRELTEALIVVGFPKDISVEKIKEVTSKVV